MTSESDKNPRINDDTSVADIAKVTIAAIAKVDRELYCAQQDLDKAKSRLSYVLAIQNLLLERFTKP